MLTPDMANEKEGELQRKWKAYYPKKISSAAEKQEQPFL